jgi:hypothetical protein
MELSRLPHSAGHTVPARGPKSLTSPFALTKGSSEPQLLLWGLRFEVFGDPPPPVTIFPNSLDYYFNPNFIFFLRDCSMRTFSNFKIRIYTNSDVRVLLKGFVFIISFAVCLANDLT